MSRIEILVRDNPVRKETAFRILKMEKGRRYIGKLDWVPMPSDQPLPIPGNTDVMLSFADLPESFSLARDEPFAGFLLRIPGKTEEES